MPKLGCRCGHIISVSNDWSAEEWMLVPQQLVESVGERVEDGSLHRAEDFYAEVDSNGIQVYRCSNCGRLHLEETRGMFTSFVHEDAAR